MMRQLPGPMKMTMMKSKWQVNVTVFFFKALLGACFAQLLNDFLQEKSERNKTNWNQSTIVHTTGSIPMAKYKKKRR